MRAEDYPVYSISKTKASRAGKILIGPTLGPETVEEKIDAFEILENWRAMHAYPLDFYNERIAELVRSGGDEANYTVARRLKRIPTIYHKLERFPEMSLGRMQDIGGIRAIVPTADEIDAFCERLVEAKNIRTLKRVYDYVATPKPSGYRSCHLVYEFEDADSPQEYRGLNVEVQVRSRIQHAWATTLETFSVFLGQALKSSQGSTEYLTFFELASAAFSLYENRPRAEKYASFAPSELVRELRDVCERLKIRESLQAFSNAITVAYSSEKDENERERGGGSVVYLASPSELPEEKAAGPKGNYVILKLNPKTGNVLIRLCRDMTEAHRLYVDLERFKAPSEEIVLVSVGSVSALLEAYPNYFANTNGFLSILDDLFATYR